MHLPEGQKELVGYGRGEALEDPREVRALVRARAQRASQEVAVRSLQASAEEKLARMEVSDVVQ